MHSQNGWQHPGGDSPDSDNTHGNAASGNKIRTVSLESLGHVVNVELMGDRDGNEKPG